MMLDFASGPAHIGKSTRIKTGLVVYGRVVFVLLKLLSYKSAIWMLFILCNLEEESLIHMMQKKESHTLTLNSFLIAVS